MSTIISLRDVTFELPNGRELFQNLTFSLDTGITALVGPNGVGKTTLARLLSKELEPSSGTIRRQGAITFFPQRKEPEAISVDEFLGSEYTWSMLGENLLEGISREALCSTLSGGQWMRVRLARTLDDHYLILDEPTNDLDRTGRNLIMQFLRERTGGALLISHDRECLGLCEEVLELSNRGLSKFGGGWLAYTEQKERERENLGQALDQARRDRDAAIANRHEQLAKQEKRNRRGAESAARGGTPKILLGARKRKAQASTGKLDSSTLDRANEAVRDLHEAFSELKVDPVMYADLVAHEIPAQKLIAEASDFNIRFQDWIYPNDLHFSWRGNLRLALKGDNGSGKSTLLKAILGESLETRGTLRRGNLTTLSIDQRCSSLDDEKTIFENIQDACSLNESEIRNGLAKFLFVRESVLQKVKDLSGGERLRAALALGFLSKEKPELIILDEPTNNLDLVNVEFLENLVREFKGALIVISHDEVFLKNCDVNQVFEPGKNSV
jgi:ATPase subunit of ABC transporter with duplicated ATPase domains